MALNKSWLPSVLNHTVMIVIWVLSNSFTITTGCQAPFDHIITICNLPCWLPPGKEWRLHFFLKFKVASHWGKSSSLGNPSLPLCTCATPQSSSTHTAPFMHPFFNCPWFYLTSLCTPLCCISRTPPCMPVPLVPSPPGRNHLPASGPGTCYFLLASP